MSASTRDVPWDRGRDNSWTQPERHCLSTSVTITLLLDHCRDKHWYFLSLTWLVAIQEKSCWTTSLNRKGSSGSEILNKYVYTAGWHWSFHSQPQLPRWYGNESFCSAVRKYWFDSLVDCCISVEFFHAPIPRSGRVASSLLCYAKNKK